MKDYGLLQGLASGMQGAMDGYMAARKMQREDQTLELQKQKMAEQVKRDAVESETKQLMQQGLIQDRADKNELLYQQLYSTGLKEGTIDKTKDPLIHLYGPQKLTKEQYFKDWESKNPPVERHEVAPGIIDWGDYEQLPSDEMTPSQQPMLTTGAIEARKRLAEEALKAEEETGHRWNIPYASTVNPMVAAKVAQTEATTKGIIGKNRAYEPGSGASMKSFMDMVAPKLSSKIDYNTATAADVQNQFNMAIKSKGAQAKDYMDKFNLYAKKQGLNLAQKKLGLMQQRSSQATDRLTMVANNNYNKEMGQIEQPILAGNKALGVINKFYKTGGLPTKEVTEELYKNLGQMFARGNVVTEGTMSRMKNPTLEGHVNEAMAYLSGKNPQILTKQQIDRLYKDILTIKEELGKQHLQKWNSSRQAMPSSVVDKLDNKWRSFRQSQGIGKK